MDGRRSEVDAAVAAVDELFRAALRATGQTTDQMLRARASRERWLRARARTDQAHAEAARNAAPAVYLTAGAATQEATREDVGSVDDVATAGPGHLLTVGDASAILTKFEDRPSAADSDQAATPRQAVPQQAAQARDAAAPGFPLSADAAVRTGPGRITPKPVGTEALPGRDQDRSR